MFLSLPLGLLVALPAAPAAPSLPTAVVGATFEHGGSLSFDGVRTRAGDHVRVVVGATVTFTPRSLGAQADAAEVYAARERAASADLLRRLTSARERALGAKIAALHAGTLLERVRAVLLVAEIDGLLRAVDGSTAFE